jgi:hypothetical protein
MISRQFFRGFFAPKSQFLPLWGSYGTSTMFAVVPIVGRYPIHYKNDLSRDSMLISNVPLKDPMWESRRFSIDWLTPPEESVNAPRS